MPSQAISAARPNPLRKGVRDGLRLPNDGMRVNLIWVVPTALFWVVLIFDACKQAYPTLGFMCPGSFARMRRFRPILSPDHFPHFVLNFYC